MSKITLSSLVLVVCAAVSSCSHLSSKTVNRPKRQGYGTVGSAWRGVDEVQSQIQLYYWDERGSRSLIWPYVSQWVPLGKDAALFHGYLINGPSDIHAGRRGPLRLFGVRGTRPVVDITDDVHLLWLTPPSTNFSALLGRAGINKIETNGPGVSIRVYEGFSEGRTLQLSCAQILEMIRTAEEKGIQMKDPGLGTPYLKRDREKEMR